MKRNKWYMRFAVATGILAALTILLWTISRPPKKESQEESMITDFHMGTVAGAALANDRGGVALMIQNGEIEILDAPVGLIFSEANRKAFLYRMAHVPMKKNLGITELWEQYGLENPQAKLTLFFTNGSKVTLCLGDKTPLEDAWYLNKEGEDTLYLVDSVTARMMRYSLDDFREIDVLPAIAPDSLKSFHRLRLTGDGQSLEIQGENQAGEIRFFMKEPFEAMLNWQAIMDMVLIPLSEIESLEFVEKGLPNEKENFPAQGEYRLEIEMDGERKELLFIPADGDTWYCKNVANGQVIIASGEGLKDFLTRPAADLLDSTLYHANGADIEQVTVMAEGFKEEFELRGQGELLRGYCGGKEWNQAETIRILKLLTMIPPAEPLGRDTRLEDEALITLYFRRKTGVEDVVELIPVSRRRCAVRVNGLASYTTYTHTVEEMIRAIKGYFQKEYFAEY
ncbi:MAG: DUF4340 domain-containing protein [Lachnospiraceae bacterium]|nr:DUF4340 domain-containing protein [Lachnospiraceae bacterium]